MYGLLGKSTHRLILEAATRTRDLSQGELHQVVEHVAQAGFDPDAGETAGGRLTGLNWQGRTIQDGDGLPPAVVHYLRHVVAQKEWRLEEQLLKST